MLVSFRAEAQRLTAGGSKRSVIYAIEEAQSSRNPRIREFFSRCLRRWRELEGAKCFLQRSLRDWPGISRLNPEASF
jgi:hypothetical protein